MINGVTELIMMKIDVLDKFKSIKICTAYEMDGKIIDHFPFELTGDVKPVFVELPGWNKNLSKINSKNEFPHELNTYIKFIENEMKIPVSIASVGPNREQTIFLKQS